MAKIISRNQLPYNLEDDIGVCYFDPEIEQLREFHPGLSFIVNPFETSVRRFYIVKPSTQVKGVSVMYTNISFKSVSEDIVFKVRLANERISSVEDFYDVTPENKLNIFFNTYPSGIIPIDVYIESKTNSNIITDVSIDLEVI